MAVMYKDEILNVEFIKDNYKCSLYLKIVSYINHGLNKLFYPAVIAIYESGFISNCYKVFPLTLNGCFHTLKHLWFLPLLIISGIICFSFKNEILKLYNDFGIYMINYLNIIDLIFFYFEFGFSLWDAIRYCYRTCKCCCNVDNYKFYMKGKIIYEKNKLSEELDKKLDEICSITSEYSQELNKYKLTEIFDFISRNGRNQNYISPKYIAEKPKKEKIENIRPCQLEKLLSEPYREAKIIERKIERLRNIYKREDAEYGGVKSCACLYRCCCANLFCEIIKLIVFCLVCFYLFCADFIIFHKYTQENPAQTNDTIINSTDLFSDLLSDISTDFSSDIFFDSDISSSSLVNNTTNEEIPSLGKQIGYFFLEYFNIFTILILTTGLFFIPILYAVVKRKPITGELIYDRGFSNDIEIIKSVKAISSMVSASLYLGALFMICIYENIPGRVVDDEEFNDFFQFFYLPYTTLVLAFKTLFLSFLSLITQLEYINLHCIEINIADEGLFFLYGKQEPFYNCIKCRCENNIELGKNSSFDEFKIPEKYNI